MKHTGAQIIVKLLEMYGIETVAGIPGGMILPLYDELNKSKIRHVLVRQEQAAGFIAQGIARATGNVAVWNSLLGKWLLGYDALLNYKCCSCINIRKNLACALFMSRKESLNKAFVLFYK